MTIRFAPARNRDALARTVAWGTNELSRVRAANDSDASPEDQALLVETLRHFATHGLSSAERAKSMAVVAARAGDKAGYNQWLSVCGMLDKRMAKTLAASVEFANI